MRYDIVAGEELKNIMMGTLADPIPFNEDMSKGGYSAAPFSRAFIAERSAVFGVTADVYREKLGAFLSVLNALGAEDEIHLYFGEDETCLANRAFLLGYLSDKAGTVRLHVVDEYTGRELSTEVQGWILSHQDIGYRDFTLPLLPGIDEKTFVGVRLPLLKKYAKSLDSKSKAEFLAGLPHKYHEENILHAFILSDMKDYDAFIRYVDAFLPYVANWSVCDTLCNKHLNKHKDELIHVVYRWMESDEVYRVRYAVKCLMNYYLSEDFDPEHLRRVEHIHLDEYYVRMMIAWYVATGLAKNYESFLPAIQQRHFDTFTHNKAIQKAIESYRVSDEHKAYLKTLKIK